MRLWQWAEQRGRGELRRIERVTAVSYTTIHALFRGKHLDSYSKAALISAATGGKVSIAECCTPLRDDEMPPSSRTRKRKRTSTRPRTRPSSAEASA